MAENNKRRKYEQNMAEGVTNKLRRRYQYSKGNFQMDNMLLYNNGFGNTCTMEKY